MLLNVLAGYSCFRQFPLYVYVTQFSLKYLEDFCCFTWVYIFSLLIFFLTIINNFKFNLITLQVRFTKFAYVSLATQLSVCFSFCMAYRPAIKILK